MAHTEGRRLVHGRACSYWIEKEDAMLAFKEMDNHVTISDQLEEGGAGESFSSTFSPSLQRTPTGSWLHGRTTPPI